MRKTVLIQFIMIMFLIFGLALPVFAGGQQESADQGSEKELKVFSYQFLGTQNLVQEMADTYMEAHPDVKIIVEEYPWNSYFENLEVRFAAENPDIDVLVMDIPMMAGYAERGFIEDLRQWIPEDEFTSKVAAGSLAAITYNGSIMASPLQNSDQYLYINKDMALEAGVELPEVYVDKDTVITDEFAKAWGEGSWTWDEAVAAARKMVKDTNGDGITDVYGLHLEQAARLYQMQPLGGSRGGQIVSPDGTTVKGYFDQQVWVDAVQFYGDLFNKYKVEPPASLLPGYDNRAELVKGSYAMMIGGGWNLKAIMNSDKNFIVAAHPRFKDGVTTTPTGSWVTGVTASTSDTKKALAAEFIKWWSLSEEGTAMWYDLTNELPATKYMLDQLANSPKFDEFPRSAQRLGVYQVLNTAEARPVTPYYQFVNEGVDKAFLDAAQGKDAKSAVMDAVELIEKKIGRVK